MGDALTAGQVARARQHAEELAWMRRLRRRDALAFLASVAASLGLGLTAMAWAVHVTDARRGMVLLYGGLAVGSVGVLAATIRWLVRAVERGDAHW